MKNFTNLNAYLEELSNDVYSQPTDVGHKAMFGEFVGAIAAEFIATQLKVYNVLDVGCGEEAFTQLTFEGMGVDYTGITLGKEIGTLKDNPKIQDMDMSFLDFEDNYFSAIFARHVLEHSPMPLLTLMEWHRVSNHFLVLIVPSPMGFGFIGRNHYSVMSMPHLMWLLRRAGWRIKVRQKTFYEFRFICEKMSRLGYEGYVEPPLSNEIYEMERDG